MSTPSAHITSTGRCYKSAPGGKRKIPPAVRSDLYQLHLTVRESNEEIRRVLALHGVETADAQTKAMRRIADERGR